MYKKLMLLIFVSQTFVLLYGQTSRTITGHVFSQVDLLPVPYAEVTIRGTTTGTITNTEGRFILAGQFSGKDTICIFHLNYEPKKIAVTELKQEENLIVMEPRVFALDEVTVQAESVVKILKHSIISSREAIVYPLRLGTYYREFVKEDQHYTKFSDGLIDYDLLEFSDKMKTRVRVNQSRAFALKSETDEKINFDLNSPLDVGKALNPFFLERLEQIAKDSDHYLFNIFKQLSEKGNKLLEISFTPCPENTEPFFEGTVIIDEATKLILSFTCRLEQNPDKQSKEKNFVLLKGKVTQFDSTVLYKLSETRYEPWYTGIQIGIRFWNNKKFDHTFLFTSDLVANSFLQSGFEPVSNKEAYNRKALYPLGSNFHSAYWKDQNTIQLTEEEENIIKSLQ